jgi:hypothetical protein
LNRSGREKNESPGSESAKRNQLTARAYLIQTTSTTLTLPLLLLSHSEFGDQDA